MDQGKAQWVLWILETVKFAYIIWKFINTAAGGEALKVGKGLEPCTREVAHIQCISENGPSGIVFVDTPPFPNPDEETKDSETAVEKQIGDWLKKAWVPEIHSYVPYLYSA